MCRVCFSSPGETNIFASAHYPKKLYEIMMEVADIQIRQNDGLPPQICKCCCERLRTAYFYKQQCEATDKFLQQCMLDPNKLPSKTIDFITNTDTVWIQPKQRAPRKASKISDLKVIGKDPFVELDLNSHLRERLQEQQHQEQLKIEEVLLPNNNEESEYENEIDSDNELIVIPQKSEILLAGDSEQKKNPYRHSKTEECPNCQKMYTKADIKRHIQIHSGLKQYKCDECNKKFSTSAILKVHIKNHNRDRSHFCEVCSKAFFNPSEVQRHMRSHSDDKIYPCPDCNKAFKTTTDVKKHQRLHTGERRFSCDICKKNFTQSSHLAEHMKRHTGDKNHVCEECGKAFNHTTSLKRHLMGHTGEKPFACEVCGRCFTQMGHLKSHIKSVHGIKM